MTETLDALRAKWPANEVKTRVQAGKTLHYISIDQNINRVLDVFDLEYNWTTTREVFEHPGQVTVREWTEKDDDGRDVVVRETSQKKSTWTVFVNGVLQYKVGDVWYAASGEGAATASDPDQATKTAFAEAYKKAGNTRGIALYLWDEEERDAIEAETNPKAKLASLKAEVAAKYKKDAKTQKMVRSEMALFFGVAEDKLDDVATLQEILDA